jgi:uncharacterized protein
MLTSACEPLKIAIVGSGIAGLGCAYTLHPHHHITVFEQDLHTGGHANTVTVLEDAHTSAERPIPIDTGFMVFNQQTYPNLCKLFKQLDVATQPTDMTFSLSHQLHNLEWRGADIPGMFGQKRNVFSPRYWRFIGELQRFNKTVTLAMAAGQDDQFMMPLSVYVATQGYSADFLNWFLVPMSCAIWSTRADHMLDFPAQTLMRFFYNHGFLGKFHPWYTVTGGSQAYVKKMTAGFKQAIHHEQPVQAVLPQAKGVLLKMEDGRELAFDAAILACHADQSLQLLNTMATPLERQLLGAFQYEANTAVLHSDPRVMPKRKACWAAWNYRVEENPSPGEGFGANAPVASTHYWMNRLQNVSDNAPYFVSINPLGPLKNTFKTIPYTHPRFDLAAITAQNNLPRLNQQDQRPVYFCGSYFKYGFHEDALTSGLDLCKNVFNLSPFNQDPFNQAPPGI